MPSDLVWVALITSGSVLAFAWLTARLARSTKQQIDAQIETAKAQIEAHEMCTENLYIDASTWSHRTVTNTSVSSITWKPLNHLLVD